MSKNIGGLLSIFVFSARNSLLGSWLGGSRLGAAGSFALSVLSAQPHPTLAWRQGSLHSPGAYSTPLSRVHITNISKVLLCQSFTEALIWQMWIAEIGPWKTAFYLSYSCMGFKRSCKNAGKRFIYEAQHCNFLRSQRAPLIVTFSLHYLVPAPQHLVGR